MEAACPHCGADLAEYDSEAGACQSCGLQVVIEQDLCFEVGRNDEGQQYGTFVSASGRVAGGRGKDGHYTPGGAIKQAMPDRAYREIEGQAERLGIVEPVKGDAVFYLETAYSTLVSTGGWHTIEIVAAACLYAAVRNRNMPVSIAETATAIGKPRHVVGAAYKVLVKTLQLSMPAFVDFSKYIQRHIAKLEPLHNSNKQAKVMSTFGKLMEWSLKHADVAAGHTSSLAAAVLHLASDAHQVKLTPEAVATVFVAKCSTVRKHIAEVRTALMAAAQLVPWLQDVQRVNVTSHLRVIIEVANAMRPACTESGTTQAAAVGLASPPSSASQFTMPGCATTAEVTNATAAPGDHQQPGATQRTTPNKKRQRSDISDGDQAAEAQAAYTDDLPVGKRSSAFVVPDLDSEQLAAETVIREHEWPQFVHVPKKLRCSPGSHTKKQLRTDISAC